MQCIQFFQNFLLSIHKRVGFVRLGEHTIGKDIDCHTDEKTNKETCNDPPVDINVQRILLHQKYFETPLQLLNDIALLRLEEPVNFTSVYCVMNLLLENIKLF